MAHSITDVLDKVKHKVDDQDHITFDEFVKIINSYGYDITVFAIALFITLPTGAIPGFPAFFSLIIIAFSIRKLMGSSKIWIPNFLKEKKISAEKVQKSVNIIEPKLKKFNDYIKPRFNILGDESFNYAVQILIILCAATIPLLGFIPFLATIPSAGVCCLAISHFRKDGILFIIGAIITLISISAIPWGVTAVAKFFS